MTCPNFYSVGLDNMPSVYVKYQVQQTGHRGRAPSTQGDLSQLSMEIGRRAPIIQRVIYLPGILLQSGSLIHCQSLTHNFFFQNFCNKKTTTKNQFVGFFFAEFVEEKLCMELAMDSVSDEKNNLFFYAFFFALSALC